MKERPILFSAPMVRAILDGRKTMTRRVIKKQPLDILPMNVPNQWCALDEWGEDGNKGSIRACRFGVPGDQLWVRETFGIFDRAGNERAIAYKADGDDGPATWVEVPKDKYFKDDYFPADERWRPSIHMPRWASRITLEITDVRVERVQEITEKDSALEGTLECDGLFDEAEYCRLTKEMGDAMGDLTPAFRQLWDSINGKTHPWESNPWVWVISFKRID